MTKLLLVEDDDAIVRSLTDFLRENGFTLCSAPGETEALRLLERERFALVLLDLSLRDGDGFRVCRHAKAAGLPVIFLTASADESHVVAGLEMGADDYIPKPFRPRELVSRIRNVLRHYGAASPQLVLGNLTLNTDSGVVTKDGEPLALSALEYRLLLLFVNNRGRLLSRARLLEDVWDYAGDFVNDNTLTVYIKRLREKIEPDPQQPTVIKTVRGLGYRMD